MRVHLIAIGGSVMHNLAISLHKNGHIVTGSDDEIFNPALTNLQNEGILPPTLGWYPDKISPKFDAVILGMHAHDDNTELKKAKELKLKIYSYPEFIYESSKNKLRIVIGGSHGKTTITSMIMHVLKLNNKQFDYMVGAPVDGFELTVSLTNNAPFIVIEGDEYPDSAINKLPKFFIYKADIALVSGIAWDHVNIFPTFQGYIQQFKLFIDRVPASGKIIFNNEDKELKKVISSTTSKAAKIAYYTPDSLIENGETFLVYKSQKILLWVFGKHNLQNIMGAKAVCNELGLNDNEFFSAISSFKGAAKRMELIGKNETTAVYKDFAHSPSKLKATIAAVKEQFPLRKLVACIELHTYSSLNKDFLQQYAGTMRQADVKIVYYNKHAFQIKKLPFIPEDEVVKGFADDSVKIFTDKEKLRAFLISMKYTDTNLLMMSSGNFDNLNLNELTTFVIKHHIDKT
jgi:UDP-N-acetylmuramate: L-alanyl-gamma-D-glutamyl-meso-diaminopimelate ligase